jgi:hypothetical protein
MTLCLKRLRKVLSLYFFEGVDYGTIYTPDLARYAAIAVVSVPDTELAGVSR